MEFLLYIYIKEDGLFMQKKKKKNPLQLSNIYVICVCFNMHA